MVKLVLEYTDMTFASTTFTLIRFYRESFISKKFRVSCENYHGDWENSYLRRVHAAFTSYPAGEKAIESKLIIRVF